MTIGVSHIADEVIGFTDGIGIAMPYDKLAPAAVKGGAFEYQKVFGEEAFAAAGVIRIPPGSSKPGKSSKDNAFVSPNLFRCLTVADSPVLLRVQRWL
jgi:hypothetical protein